MYNIKYIEIEFVLYFKVEVISGINIESNLPTFWFVTNDFDFLTDGTKLLIDSKGSPLL